VDIEIFVNFFGLFIFEWETNINSWMIVQNNIEKL
jgi:hypothetical protein